MGFFRGLWHFFKPPWAKILFAIFLSFFLRFLGAFSFEHIRVLTHTPYLYEDPFIYLEMLLDYFHIPYPPAGWQFAISVYVFDFIVYYFPSCVLIFRVLRLKKLRKGLEFWERFTHMR